MDDLEAVGAVIRRARKDNRLTQLQLAELAAISERTLRDIEKGRPSVALGAVAGVAAVLGLRVVVI